MSDEKLKNMPPEKDEIVKIEGQPIHSEDGHHTRLDALINKPFVKWLKNLFQDSEEIAREYAEGKTAQETSTAKKIVEEAGEISARRDKIIAETNRTNSDTDSIRQDVVSKMITNLERINALPSDLQAFAFAELIAQNPELLDQVEKVKSILNYKKAQKGLSITVLPKKEVIDAKGKK